MELADRTWWALRAGEVAGARFDELKAPIVAWRLAAALAGCEMCVSPDGFRGWMADWSDLACSFPLPRWSCGW